MNDEVKVSKDQKKNVVVKLAGERKNPQYSRGIYQRVPKLIYTFSRIWLINILALF